MDELTEPFARLIEDVCSPAAIRAVVHGGDWRGMWQAFVDSGFLDALVPEEAGGAGLSPADAVPLLTLLGRHAVPLPAADTMMARMLLTRAGQPVPSDPIVIGTDPFADGIAAEHRLTGTYRQPRLSATSRKGAAFDGEGIAVNRSGEPACEQLRAVAASIRAHLIAGACARVLEMTIGYANDRQQFGKPIGRQQAVQQQLAVLAEQCVAARLAAAIGWRAGFGEREPDAAIAKHGTSVAAAEISAIAHAVFGAIGISEEHDLQLLTSSLHRWRLADGGPEYWAGRLGRRRTTEAGQRSVAWITGLDDARSGGVIAASRQ